MSPLDSRRSDAGAGGAPRGDPPGAPAHDHTGASARTGEATRPYFSCRNLHAYYGESYIVQGVGFDVREGEILALLGRNGAGKTSTLRTIARLADPQLREGEIWLDGVPLHGMKAWQAARHGVGLVPEDRRIIGGLTVHENLQLARIETPRGWSLERIYEHFPRLAERRTQEAVTLSGGEQQMLAVARALARDIKLLLLDEPYEGLAPVIVREIEKILQEVRAQGFTTIIVEQNAVAALSLSDRAIILEMGEVVFDGSARDVLDNAELRHEYLAI
jgi:branched-chain amino acid transport system ATP-binding protein